MPSNNLLGKTRSAMSFIFLGYIGIAGNVTATVLIDAHRGASSFAPENTIASINAAAGIADLTEFDVRLTSDGELVLMHDSTIDRTSNGSGSVATQTLSQLRSLDAGSWYSPSFAGEQIPTLTEAINASFAANLTPLIERKAGSASDYHSEFSSQGFASNDFRVISFDWNFLNDLDSFDSSYQLGALGSGTMSQSVIDNALSKGADFFSWRASNIDQAAVDLVQSNGMELHVWTVNDSCRMEELIGYGVDGITTDNPSLLNTIVNPTGASAANLLLNSGLDCLNSWTTAGGGAIRTASPDAFEGNGYLFGGATASFSAHQDVDLVSAGLLASTIDQGVLEAVYGGSQAGYTNDGDYGVISLEFLDESGDSLGSSILDSFTSERLWEEQSGTADVPVGTRTIRYQFTGTRVDGTNLDAYLDAAYLHVVPEPSSAALLGLGSLALILRRRAV